MRMDKTKSSSRTLLEAKTLGRTSPYRPVGRYPKGEGGGSQAASVIPAKERVKKSKLQASGTLPQRHSREGGNPFNKLEQALVWLPAFAGTTLRHRFHASPILSRARKRESMSAKSNGPT